MIGMIMIVGLLMELVGLYYHGRDLRKQGSEGAAAFHEQVTKFGKTSIARNAGLFVSLSLVMLLVTSGSGSVAGLSMWLLTATLMTMSAVFGRALFYALVIPTTMPGAFFWRNKGFEEHAREIGLANMPQVGVLPDVH